jgi:hypothetical protein
LRNLINYFFLVFAERGSAGVERSDPAALPRVAPFPFARRREGAPAGARRQALGGSGGALPPRPPEAVTRL